MAGKRPQPKGCGYQVRGIPRSHAPRGDGIFGRSAAGVPVAASFSLRVFDRGAVPWREKNRSLKGAATKNHQASGRSDLCNYIDSPSRSSICAVNSCSISGPLNPTATNATFPFLSMMNFVGIPVTCYLSESLLPEISSIRIGKVYLLSVTNFFAFSTVAGNPFTRSQVSTTRNATFWLSLYLSYTFCR